MSNFAKPIDELLNAKPENYNAMIAYTDYFILGSELINDILKMFCSPVLSAALHKLIEYIRERERSYTIMKSAGYTTDDAFTLHSYEETTAE